MTMTITEGLAEIKTIGKRIEKKQGFIGEFLFRQDFLKDPHDKDGGSAALLSAEHQAIADLETRHIAIRREIELANAKTTLSVGGVERSIADWLVWRREIAPRQQTHLAKMRSALMNARTAAQQRGVQIRSAQAASGTDKPNDVIVNVDEGKLAKDAEQLETVLGTLDGLLSLKNATLFINV